MRLTRVLYKQHIDRMFKEQWKFRRTRVAVDNGAEAELKELGVPLTDPFSVVQSLKPPLEKFNIDVVGMMPKPVIRDETHPLYHSQPCYAYHENSVLVEGTRQAQALINAVEIKKGLPTIIEELAKSTTKEEPENIDNLVQRCILGSRLFDAVQVKLPKIKDPDRPAFNFSRVYGIPDHRRNRLMVEGLLRICGAVSKSISGPVVRAAPVRACMERAGDRFSFDVTPAVMLTTSTPLAPPADTERSNLAANLPLPDIFPLKPTISIQTTQFYEDKNIFPVPHIHTAVFNFNETQVKNLHEEPVTEDQVLARTMTHTFAVAAAMAKRKFGSELNDTLPEPITVQGVQTDGCRFHFVVLQLNTLATEGVRNIIWSSPIMPIFSSCRYVQGAPTLEGYDPQVFRNFFAFHKNGNQVTK